MFGRKQSHQKKQQPGARLQRIYVPGREFATGKDFADYVREVELVKVYESGPWI